MKIMVEVVGMSDYVLRSSLEDHKIITIMYVRNEEISQRNIKVLKIKDDEIEAYCYLRHQVRHFKKENILSAGYIH